VRDGIGFDQFLSRFAQPNFSWIAVNQSLSRGRERKSMHVSIA